MRVATAALPVAVLAAGVLASTAGAAVAAVPGPQPACFGAEARDPRRPCVNPSLAVFPPVDDIDADFRDGSPCKPVPGDPAPICAFGVSKSKAKRHFALLGDSHALHWRRALDVVALSERWRGFSITTAGCPFSAAVKDLGGGLREYCSEWYRAALRWLRSHREVSTVFISQFAPMPLVVDGELTGSGTRNHKLKMAGVRRMLRALPRSVKHVVTIRDNPLPTQEQFDCVDRVAAAGTADPGTACASGRGALRWDATASAARLLKSRRFDVVDLSEFFCDRRHCYPVVGGARVFRDPFGHITTAYSRTLGPFLRREIRALMKRW